MDYLVLNRESIPYQSKEDAKSRFPIFLNIVESASKERITTIRAEGQYGVGWFEFPLFENYVVRNWLEEQEQEYKTKIRSIISNTYVPIIPDTEKDLLARYELSEFKLTEDSSIKTPSLGATYLLNQLALSFYSNEYWNNRQISIEKYEIDANTKIESTTTVSVANTTTLEHWNHFLNLINKQKEESLLIGNNLWDERELQYPNLIFCGKTESQFKKFSFSKNKMMKIIEILNLMNSFCNEHINDFTVESFKNTTQLDFSKESDSVLNNRKLKALREFRKTDEEKVYFEWHVKNIPNTRLYFQFDFENKKIHIGYIGKHLPTKRN